MMPFLPEALVSIVGWTLIHLLWQSLLIYSAQLALRSVVGLAHPRVRYAISCVALLAVLLAGVATVHRLSQTTQVHQSAGPTSRGYPAAVQKSAETGTRGLIVDRRGGLRYPVVERPSLAERFAERVEPLLPGLVMVWLGGVLFSGWQQVMGLHRLNGLLASARSVGEPRQDRFKGIARAIGLDRAVRFLQIDGAGSPFAAGWLRPVVVLPVSILNSCSVAEVDAIVAHELAHLRRLDRLIDLAQIVIETVLVFHLPVRMICRALDDDRELCSDAAAVRFTGGAKAYASMLTRLQEGDHGLIRVQTGFFGRGGGILERVRAIGIRNRGRHQGLASCLSTVLTGVLCSVVIGASVADSAISLRNRRQWGRQPEWQFVTQTLGIKDAASMEFRAAYVHAIQAVVDDAPPTDPRFERLIEVAQNGVDMSLVWRDFEPLVSATAFPIIPSEFPRDWPFADGPTHLTLVSKLWKLTKSQSDPQVRRTATVATLGVAAMRREQISVLALRTVVTDRSFEVVSGLGSTKVVELRQYWSAAQDAAGLAVKEIQRRYGSTVRDDAPINACGERVPGLRFVAAYLDAPSHLLPKNKRRPVIVDHFRPRQGSP